MNHLIDWSKYRAAVWRTQQKSLKPIKEVDYIELDCLLGIETQIQQICDNTALFLSGQSANHVLLWGARGMGKSSIIKGLLNKYHSQGLRVIEIPKEDLIHLLDITDILREEKYQFIIFCDDLSFEEGDASYKTLKSNLEGTIEAPPKNILIYATSNRRHLMPEKMNDNLNKTLLDAELHQADVVEERMSLSDRFGLMLSFYAVDQDTYLKMVDAYFEPIPEDVKQMHQEAIKYAMQKGTRSGRVAKQFRDYYPLLNLS